MDSGASPADALRRVLLPLLAPAILSSFFIVFAISIDDFVISQFLCAQDCTTIPIKHLQRGPQRREPEPERARHDLDTSRWCRSRSPC